MWKAISGVLGLVRYELFVVGKQQLLALTNGSELAGCAKRLVYFSVKCVVCLDEFGRHCEWVVVLS